MKRFFALMLALSVFVIPTYADEGEHFDVAFPKGEEKSWKKELSEQEQDGRYFEVWKREDSKAEEQLIIVSAPLPSSEDVSIDEVIETVMTPIKQIPEAKCEVIEKQDKEAVISCVVGDKEITYSRMKLTSKTFCSITYTYRGDEPQGKETKKWIEHLKEAKICD